jgi:CRISPR system Cascade subunit CasD
LEDYVGLRLGVRIDQPGRLLRDFQTARSLDGQATMPLSYRYFREDARYLAVVHAQDELLETLVGALRRPAYPLYLGRRACPPAEPLVPRLSEATIGASLRDEPWRAAPWWRRRCGDEPPMLEFRVDRGAAPELANRVDGSTVQRDVPLSFDPENRQYGWRTVELGSVPVPGAPAPPAGCAPLTHDPLEAVD